MKTTKRIFLTLEDNRVFSVSAHDVADNRAKYYVSEDPTTTYKTEYQYAVNNDEELKDWLLDNMDWYEMEHRVEVSHAFEALNEVPVWDIEVKEATNDVQEIGKKQE